MNALDIRMVAPLAPLRADGTLSLCDRVSRFIFV
jgi:hypothetical protein